MEQLNLEYTFKEQATAATKINYYDWDAFVSNNKIMIGESVRGQEALDCCVNAAKYMLYGE